MTGRDWQVVHVVVYPPGKGASARIEEAVRLPRGAGFLELLEALKSGSPTVYEQVRRCIDGASMEEADGQPGSPAVRTLVHYFTLGGPLACPSPFRDTTETIAQPS